MEKNASLWSKPLQVFFVSGIVHFLYMFVGYNWIAEKVGVARVHRAAGIVSVVLSAMVPFIGYLDWGGAGIITISLVLVTLINSTSFMVRALVALLVSWRVAVTSTRRTRVPGESTADSGMDERTTVIVWPGFSGVRTSSVGAETMWSPSRRTSVSLA